jgi:signal transduction histidine kinase
MMILFFKKILNNGIQENLPDTEKKLVMISNFSLVIASIIDIIFIFVHYMTDDMQRLIMTAALSLVFVISYLLIGKHYYKSAKIFAIVSIILNLTIDNLLAQKAFGAHFFYFAMIAGIFSVFSYKERKYSFILSSLTILTFFIIIWYPDILESQFGIVGTILPENVEIINQLFSYSTAIIAEMMILFYLIHKNHKAELKLSELNSELSKSKDILVIENKTKDKFISILAHDLRNPIGGMKSMLELINNDFKAFDQEELSEIIKEMGDTTGNVFKLLEELLSWSISQSGHIELSPNNMHISHLIEPAATLYEASLSKKNIYFDIILHEHSRVYCDQNSISTVIRNLLSNAIKFTPDGGQIVLEAKYYDDEMILVSISDTGIGMSEKVIANLFDLDKSRSTLGTEGEKGTGLGLSICREFLILNGGKIWAESGMNEGSILYFTIPKSK